MKPVLKTFSVLSLIMCAQLLSACGGSSGGGAKLDQNTPNQAPMQDVIGTGDGGGGNAINFKMLESHIVDPRELPAVKNRAASIVQKLSTSEYVTGVKKSNPFQMKTWYMAPISLKTLPKEVLGIEFTSDRVQQVAIQTENEIWIDANLFNKMSEEEQARLIIHELFMSIYMYRFKTFAEICKINDRMGGEPCGSTEQIGLADKVDEPAEPLRRLNEKDYNIIRTMTAWVFMNESRLDNNLFTAEARRLDFIDKRFAHSSYPEYSELSLEVTKQQIVTALNSAQFSKSLGSECTFVKMDKTIQCVLEIEVHDIEKSVDSVATVTLKNRATGEVLQQGEITLFDKQILHRSSADSSYSLAVYSRRLLTAAPGEKGKFFVLSFDAVQFSQEIQVSAIAMSSAVYAGDVKQNNSDNCVERVISRMNAETLEDDMVVLAKSQKSFQLAKYLSTYSRLGSTICRY